MQPILHRDAPNLASIILRDESANRGGLGEQPASKSPSTLTLFNDIAPRLHTLDILRHCYFDARVQWLSNLRSTTLLPCHSTIPMILSIFKSTPLLRRLKVIGNSDESPSLTEHIDLELPLLPHLEHLELKDHSFGGLASSLVFMGTVAFLREFWKECNGQ
ncbi:hypothetical protein CPC08DRAFT_822936 [Agrocybe pediades]|nr:hypothetical protein CPC08DRAFT_822936 [Agrocybe pediades]